MHPSVNGTVAVVTGAANGIGAATARHLAGRGASVVVCDVDPGGATVAKEIGGHFVRADVASESDWHAVAATAVERFGGIDHLVSNAAFAELAPADALSLESWNRQIAVNLTGTFLGVSACVSEIRARRGSIVIVSSVHALIGLPGRPAYAASKGGLTALTRQLAVEYGPDLRVNAVIPGPILTGAWDDVTEDDRAESVRATVLKRFGRPEEVAAVVGFLASPESSYITGQSIVIDGGWSIVKDSA